MTLVRRLALYLLAAFYGAAGVMHLAYAAPFIRITPVWVPQPALVVALTGIAEIAGMVGLLQPWFPALRRAAGCGLALYALCVWPANYNHLLLDMARADRGAGLAYHVPRLAAQPLIIWLALWVSEVTDWPWRQRRASL